MLLELFSVFSTRHWGWQKPALEDYFLAFKMHSYSKHKGLVMAYKQTGPHWLLQQEDLQHYSFKQTFVFPGHSSADAAWGSAGTMISSLLPRLDSLAPFLPQTTTLSRFWKQACWLCLLNIEIINFGTHINYSICRLESMDQKRRVVTTSWQTID